MSDTATRPEPVEDPFLDDADPTSRITWRRDLVWVGGATALVALAAIVPIVMGDDLRGRIFADAAPLFGRWLPHMGPGTIPAVVIGVAAVVVLPIQAPTLRWGRLLVVISGVATMWTFALALIDGWQRGMAGRLTRPDEYLAEVPGVHDIPATLEGFAGRIVDFGPESWTTHVSGHPPGALLTFVWLDRLGLGGGAWAGVWCVLVGCSGTAAVLIALRRLGAEDWARRCAPFLALFPGLVWVGVSADGALMGVAAWGVAALAVSATTSSRRASAIAGVVAGVILGWAIFLNYGAVLMGFVALAVLIAARSARPLLWAIPGALAVVAVFWAYGFWWFDGYFAVVERYYQGIASTRPFSYWGWANFAATLCALGPAAAGGIGRLCRRSIWTRPAALLAIGGVLAILAADVSALSKAETERIWLPFGLWVMIATALLPARHQRWWLSAQVVLALAVNHLVLTYW
ncbi:hypothetical protein [Gordonia soli]|uniref:Integral membrane protein n=1 Tax=Gordonia soli NBRC 108243 TaxID=1223545 RepID=M0QGN5_9ACTN|nr:hypothetical protein [Gordonia soli]GAC66572.1 hypothetical protein GS4_03_00190 [Gordonia soli NBRC 108243]